AGVAAQDGLDEGVRALGRPPGPDQRAVQAPDAHGVGVQQAPQSAGRAAGVRTGEPAAHRGRDPAGLRQGGHRLRSAPPPTPPATGFAWRGIRIHCNHRPASVAEQADVRSPRRREPTDVAESRSGGPLERRTARLRLTAIGPAHADELHRLYQDPGIAQWAGPALSPAAARDLAAHIGERWRLDGVHKWIAHDRTTGGLVGRGGLSRTALDGEPVLEVGWAVRTPLWGRGYATEMGAEALRFAAQVLGATEVVAFTEVHNRRSRAVVERLGMRYDRAIRRPGLVAGREGVHPDAPFALYRIGLTPAAG